MCSKENNLIRCFIIILSISLIQKAIAQTPGTQKWAFETGSIISSSSPAIGADGTVYIGSNDKKLYAINPDGTQKWTFATGGSVESPALGADGTVYVGSWDNKLYAINPNGTQKWTFSTNNYGPFSPAIGADGTVYLHCSELYAINPNGTEKWSVTTGGGGTSYPAAIGADGTVYIGSNDKKLYAINPNGTQKWACETGSYISSSPAIGADGTVYISSGDKIYAINLNGTQKWAFTTGYVWSSPAIGVDGAVYIGSDNNKLYAINPDGTQKWAFTAGGSLGYSSPAIGTDGTVYVGSDDKKFYAVNPDGTQKWSFNTEDNIRSSPAVGADGSVYIGSNDKKLYSIVSTSNGLAQSPWPKFGKDNKNTRSNFNPNCPIVVAVSYNVYADLGKSVALDGSQSYDPDGDPLSFKWECTQKPEGSIIVIVNPTLSKTNVNVNTPGYYSFSLTITDNSDGISSKTVKLTCGIKWGLSTGDQDVHSSPSIGVDGTVYVGSYDSKLYAIKPDGTRKWTFATGGYILSSPAIGADGTVYIGSSSNKLCAINPDGSQKWAFIAGMHIFSSPAIGIHGTVYVGSGDGKLYAINPDGTQKWAFTTGWQVNSSPAIGADGMVYVGSADGKLYAINPDGTQKWAFTMGGYINSSPAIAADCTVYIGSDNNKLYAINPDGTRKWAFTTGGSIVYSSPAIGTDGTVYVGSNDKKLYAINPDSTLKWAFATGGYIQSSPSIGADSTVYVGSDDKKFYALNPNGTLKWSFTTGDYVESSPAIAADGTVYVGSNDGKLYAIVGANNGLAQSCWPKFHQNNRNTGNSKIGFSNEQPILIGGKVFPVSGHEQTNFALRTTYVDKDDDAPSFVMVKIDNNQPVRMVKKGNNNDYIQGVNFELVTKLTKGTHSYSFSANDGFSEAKGDIRVHTGPMVNSLNTNPLISNGKVYPETGTPGTEFCFSVIYSDADNDSCSGVFLRLDKLPPVLMSRENKSDSVYTDGVIYQYKTKLNLGSHVFAFSARDWESDAIGDVAFHNGPDVVSSGIDPALINGSVVPQIGGIDTVFTFSVRYINSDGLPPTSINIKIDNDVFPLIPVESKSDFTTGATYQYRTKLGLGSHHYLFNAKTGNQNAKGDTTIHSGPTVADLSSGLPYAGRWSGLTSQGYPVSFTVSENKDSVLDFRSSVYVYGSITIDNTVTARDQTMQSQISKMKISDKSINGRSSAGAGSTGFKGTFNSPVQATGTFDGLTVVAVYIGYMYQLYLVGSGTWQASLLSLIAIESPSNLTLVRTPVIQVTGSAAGPLVKTANLNGIPVSDSFNKNVTLNEGQNAIVLTALDSSGGVVGTHRILITLDSTPPIISITEPSSEQVINQSDVVVKGTVNDPSILSLNVNEMPVNIINGSFNTTISLNEGQNKIIALAYDRAGNCGNDSISVLFVKSNIAPIANAGPDQSINEGSVVTLDGSASSDPDNDPITYKWTAPAGITLNSTSVAKPTFTAPEISQNTTYTFSLVVNDGKADSPADQVIITVKQVNIAPAKQASNLVASGITGNSATVKWTKGNGSRSVVFVKQGTDGTPEPVDNTSCTADAGFGKGSQTGSSGWYCVYLGSDSTVTITGLSSRTTYKAMAISFNGNAGDEKYLRQTAAGNPATFTTTCDYDYYGTNPEVHLYYKNSTTYDVEITNTHTCGSTTLKFLNATLTANAFNITVNAYPNSGTMNGTLSSDGSSFSGTYNIVYAMLHPIYGYSVPCGTKSGAWNATRKSSVPAVPVLISPMNNMTDRPVDLTLQWNPSPGAVTYSLHVSKTPDFSAPFISKNGINTEYYNLQGLTHSTTYYWRVSAADECDSSSWSELWNFTTVSPVGIDKFFVNGQVRIYPNPAKEKITVEFNRPVYGEAGINLYEPSGRLLLVKPLVSQKSEIDVSKLTHGIYFVKIQSGTSVFIKKLVIF